MAHLGPVPINWYGLGWAAAFITAASLVRRWAPRLRIAAEHVEGLLLWTLVGSLAGARLYFVAQNDPVSYLYEPWRILAIWEGGLAFFGGLFGATLAALLYTKHAGVSFSTAADLFAPAIPIAAAVGRLACGLAGMDYGTATTLPWGLVYTHPASYAPVDGIARHPVQFYEMGGDLVIAPVLLRMRGKLPQGGLFVLYLLLFGGLRFGLFFVRGDVPPVALGLTNGHWTALALVAVSLPLFVLLTRRNRPGGNWLAVPETTRARAAQRG